ncbi:hypothetical protein PQX77_020657 [Marasmius sp. AFHP31]|nr:hypothetical protein PQX77_020657 [Marasmius sp. AFHP31]
MAFRKTGHIQVFLELSLRVPKKDRNQLRCAYLCQSLSSWYDSDDVRDVGEYPSHLPVLLCLIFFPSVYIDQVGFYLEGTLLDDPTNLPVPAYLFVQPMPIEFINNVPCIRYPFPENLFYWSHDPTQGRTAIAEEDWGRFGIPDFSVTEWIGSYWKWNEYGTVREHLHSGNYDLNGKQYAREHGYPELIHADPHDSARIEELAYWNLEPEISPPSSLSFPRSVFYWSHDPQGRDAIYEEDWMTFGAPGLAAEESMGSAREEEDYNIVWEHLDPSNYNLDRREYMHGHGYPRLNAGPENVLASHFESSTPSLPSDFGGTLFGTGLAIGDIEANEGHRLGFPGAYGTLAYDGRLSWMEDTTLSEAQASTSMMTMDMLNDGLGCSPGDYGAVSASSPYDQYGLLPSTPSPSQPTSSLLPLSDLPGHQANPVSPTLSRSWTSFQSSEEERERHSGFQ